MSSKFVIIECVKRTLHWDSSSELVIFSKKAKQAIEFDDEDCVLARLLDSSQRSHHSTTSVHTSKDHRKSSKVGMRKFTSLQSKAQGARRSAPPPARTNESNLLELEGFGSGLCNPSSPFHDSMC